MPPEKLVHMANQIAAFFRSQPGPDPAQRVAAHLADFWESRMLDALAAHVAAGGDGLDPLARAALARLRPPAPGP